jgi:hypothetical protein
VTNCYVLLVVQSVGLNTEQSIDWMECGLNRIERDVNFFRLAARSHAQGCTKYLGHQPTRISGNSNKRFIICH